jgi:cyclopropane fatty-acyl-phospholipid synthase-like methyltransferase
MSIIVGNNKQPSKNYSLILVAVAWMICSVAGLVTTTPTPSDYKAESPTEPNFHKVLERLGKSVLRPGGSRATRMLQQWANLSAGDSVLELSAGLGKSSIALAQKYGCNVLVTDIDKDRLRQAAACAKELGLQHLVQTQELDMFDLDGGLGNAHFDCVMTEASITHFPYPQKIQFFEGIAKHSSKFLLHEICFKTNDIAIQDTTKRDMAKALRIGFFPETADTWKHLLQDAGFTREWRLETSLCSILLV